MKNLLDFTHAEIKNFFETISEKPFRGTQVFQWIHQYGITDFQHMSNLSKNLRDKLTELATVTPLEIALEQKSRDGTIKWLLRLKDGNCIETVYIPENNRGTLCVSSQVGCALNCTFCQTAQQGFNRNLSTAEIIGQVWLAVRLLSQNNKQHDHHITNVVMMGMGEPLYNFNNVVKAMNIMMDDHAYGLSKYRVTLSTSGLVPEMLKLKEVSEAALALSLHAPNNELRDRLIPINRKYNIEMLMDACRNYFPPNSKRQVTIEYVMLDKINDTRECAKELIKILHNVPAKVNLIPFNPFPGTPYRRSPDSVIEVFKQILNKAGLQTNIRKTRGDDIAAACGTLAGDFVDRTKRRIKINIPIVEETAA